MVQENRNEDRGSSYALHTKRSKETKMRKQVKVRLEAQQLTGLTARATATGQSVGQYLKALVKDDIKSKRLKVTYV